jgi:hypothetical protein
MKEEELAFLKAHLVELPATALRQLRRDILQERRRIEAEASAKEKGSGHRPKVAKDEAPALLQTAPRPTVASAKPTSWTRLTRAVRWNLPQGAQLPG